MAGICLNTPLPSTKVVLVKLPSWFHFGAFIRVFEGIEGLVHISELAEQHAMLRSEQVVQVGDRLFVRLSISVSSAVVSHSLKQANPATHEVEIKHLIQVSTRCPLAMMLKETSSQRIRR
jgi:ribosomal protein S1